MSDLDDIRWFSGEDVSPQTNHGVRDEMSDLANKRYPCEYCGGRGFVVSGENDSYCCSRCKGDCDDPVFEQGRICGRRAGIEEALAVANAHQGESVISLRMALKALLEAK